MSDLPIWPASQLPPRDHWWIEGYLARLDAAAAEPPMEAEQDEPGQWEEGQAAASRNLETFDRLKGS